MTQRFEIKADEWFEASTGQRAIWIHEGAYMTHEELKKYAEMQYAAGQLTYDEFADALASSQYMAGALYQDIRIG